MSDKLVPTLPTLYECAALCALSYRDRGTERIGEEAIRTGVRGGWTVIAVRGSDSPQDWLSNFRMSKGEDGIHDGFESGAQDILWRCASIVLESSVKGSPVMITGHSRGGALAEVVALNLGLPCVTFGAPRVFSPTFLEAHRTVQNELMPEVTRLPAVRCVVPGDPVPYVPPLSAKYQHRAPETLLTKRGPRRGQSFLSHVNSVIRWRRALVNHDIKNYLRLTQLVTVPTERLSVNV